MVNNSDYTLTIALTQFSFPCISFYDVAEKVHFDTTKRILSWGIPGLFIWPLLIPAVMEAVESPKANERMLADYSAKSLSTQDIRPHSTVEGVIFVPRKHFNRNFSLTLINKTTYEKVVLSTAAQVVACK